VLWGDAALRDKLRLAFLGALQEAAVDFGSAKKKRLAHTATRLLGATMNFEREFRDHWHPMLLASGEIDGTTDDAKMIAVCSRLIESIADVPPDDEGV
jgi:hypothetical protein